LGIKDGYGKIDVDNPIPVEQRPIVVIPEFSLSSKFDKWNEYFKLIASVIEEHPEERGLIHSVSFDLGKRIVDAMPRHIKKRMIVTGKRNEIVDWMRANKDGIVVSPSIEKGYDFKGNLARFQILAKIPFGYLGDPHIKLNLERSSDWYARKSILRLVQASGRAVRGVDDWATTYILDGAFMRLARQNGKIFPQWYLDAIEVLEND
jgi:Rad3-related DNA helicase